MKERMARNRLLTDSGQMMNSMAGCRFHRLTKESPVLSLLGPAESLMKYGLPFNLKVTSILLS